ncbi:MAG TPA: hypothetical protein VES79_11085 [Solirubrobacteraceae bacterium]|nr:hypothetical protein [Solirubrobacteraceae bacterium]
MPTAPTRARLYPPGPRGGERGFAGNHPRFPGEMRTMFLIYVVLIASGLAAFILVGMTHH